MSGAVQSLVSQIEAIADLATRQSSSLAIGELRTLSDAVRAAERRIEGFIESRVKAELEGGIY